LVKKFIFEPALEKSSNFGHMNKVHDTIVGVSGIGGIELLNHSGIMEQASSAGNIGVVVQGIIGIVTLVKLLLPEVRKTIALFKKKKVN
jgi:hypothetical protein